MHARLSVLVFLLIGLTACGRTASVEIRDFQADDLHEFPAISGKYAGWLQSGGWNLTAESTGKTCRRWRFETNLNPSHERVIRQILKDSVEEMVFVSHALSAEEMLEGGFDAQIFVYQTNASSTFRARYAVWEFLHHTVDASVELSSIVAVTDKDGLSYQKILTGRGIEHVDVPACENVGSVMKEASVGAVRHLGKTIGLYLQEGIGNRQ